MPQDQVVDQVQQVGQRLADGQRLFGEGKVTEALVLAEQLVHDDPDNIAVMALKGDCLERQGDIEGALFCYENIVTLRPDSPLDRIRVAQLRRMAQATPLAPEARPDRRHSIMAAVAAFVLLTSAGSAIVLANRKDPVASEKVAMVEPTQAKPFVSPAPVPSQGDAANKVDTANPGTQAPDGTDVQVPDNQGTAPNVNRGPSARGNESRGVGIGTNGIPNPGDDGYQPVSPNIVTTPENQTRLPDPVTNGDPDPVAVKNGGEKTKTDSTRQPIIDIHPSTGGNTGESVGGSQSRENSANEGKTLIQVARQYFLAGEYDKAAKAYEKAIKQGASPASANHRLAQCYLNLNRRGDALNAYQRALASYQKMVDQGVGDKRLVESYMDECRQAIRLLQ